MGRSGVTGTRDTGGALIGPIHHCSSHNIDTIPALLENYKQTESFNEISNGINAGS